MSPVHSTRLILTPPRKDEGEGEDTRLGWIVDL